MPTWHENPYPSLSMIFRGLGPRGAYPSRCTENEPSVLHDRPHSPHGCFPLHEMRPASLRAVQRVLRLSSTRRLLLDPSDRTCVAQPSGVDEAVQVSLRPHDIQNVVLSFHLL